MKRRGLDGRFPRKPEPIENPIRGFARAAFSFWTGRQVSILFATFFFCSVVLFPGACIGLMGLSMCRSPAWEPDEQGMDSIKRVFRLSGKNRFPRMFRSFVRVLPGRGGDGAFGLFRSGKTICRFFRHAALWAVFRRFQLVFIDDSKRMRQEKQKNYSIKLLFEIIGLGHFLRHFHRFS